MKIQHMLLVVGVVVLALLLAIFLPRSPEPQDVAATSHSAAPAQPPQPEVVRRTDAEQREETPVAAASAGQAPREEAPAKPAIVVRTDVRRQSSREVSIGLVLASSDGRTLPVTSVVRTQQPPPGFRIVNEAGQVVAQGNFAYG
ncbi:MAG: hypothetical protein FJ280_23710 [Planctomycetes bacterium]|nr:hypothetical protein [Planctomycetota bacterium]